MPFKISEVTNEKYTIEFMKEMGTIYICDLSGWDSPSTPVEYGRKACSLSHPTPSQSTCQRPHWEVLLLCASRDLEGGAGAELTVHPESRTHSPVETRELRCCV